MIKILLSRKLGELRWTQADLARATGIRPSTINEMYHELCERVNLEHLDLICDALDCDLDEIIIRLPNKTAIRDNESRKLVHKLKIVRFPDIYIQGTDIQRAKFAVRSDCDKLHLGTLLSSKTTMDSRKPPAQ